MSDLSQRISENKCVLGMIRTYYCNVSLIGKRSNKIKIIGIIDKEGFVNSDEQETFVLTKI